MARIVPNGWEAVEVTGAASREIETLRRLGATLPAEYTVYHGVHWTRLSDGFSICGTADFVIVDGRGQVLVIEQKSGFLTETDAGLYKAYPQRARNVVSQLARTTSVLSSRLRSALREPHLRVEGLLYCPDYTVKSLGSVGIDPTRIVDATRKDQLPAIIQGVFVDGEVDSINTAKIHRFLSDDLALAVDANAVLGSAGEWVTRLSGGLATWARRLELEPHRLRVIGTAGSGKTQLAIKVVDDALMAGRRVLYVCYNRPLADHITRIAPANAEVATFHQLCDRVLRDAGTIPEFGDPNVFRWMEDAFAAAPVTERWTFDVLVVDEGQDFEARWVAPLFRLLRDAGSGWWLEDPMQNLYMREPVSLPGWAVLHADTNYRSPREVLGLLNRWLGDGAPIEPGSPFGGAAVDIAIHDNAASPLEDTKRAITHALTQGFRREDIVVLSFRGRERSVFTDATQIGPHTLRAFDGVYDLFGSPAYRPGDVLLESIYRFKGQSAPCVIFTEIDFEVLDERALRKLLVGATRATMKLSLVLSHRAAVLLDVETAA